MSKVSVHIHAFVNSVNTLTAMTAAPEISLFTPSTYSETSSIGLTQEMLITLYKHCMYFRTILPFQFCSESTSEPFEIKQNVT